MLLQWMVCGMLEEGERLCEEWWMGSSEGGLVGSRVEGPDGLTAAAVELEILSRLSSPRPSCAIEARRRRDAGRTSQDEVVISVLGAESLVPPGHRMDPAPLP